MTAATVISRVDDLSPNYYTAAQKLGWLASLDGKIYEEVILTHEGADDVDYDPTDYSANTVDLIVQPPYGEDLYCHYLCSRIAAANSEIAKYDQFATLFNADYIEWTGWYNRHHMPLKKGRWVL